ncbi:MAG TPA: cysteine--tRNA ligase [Candidatus Nanoarchaeia archaeon]|nr:cysteine--tRNA ligase [Candidatus Nanoarchaeia archaeon]
MKIFNTLTRKKEELQPIKKGVISLWACGPTVYNYAHIGNLRTYIFEDLLKRTLIYDGFKVNHVMNITDVGHLTSDQDSGEDKMELGAKRENKTAWQIAEFYTKAFQQDMRKLNILPPTKWCRATDHIKEQVELIKQLEKKKYTYKIDDGVYFDTSKLKDYGKLAKLDIQGLQEGARVDVRGKKNKTDFALWKFSPVGEKRQMEWISPWGKGFPGWHIECSAMAQKYLGNPFDIHCGGIDHIPVHHTNEIAQTEAATGKPLANIWMHGEFLVDKEEKMSKSKGNILTLTKVEQEGYEPEVFRYACLTTHYRMPLSFSWEALAGAKNALNHLREKIKSLTKRGKKTKESEKYKMKFKDAVNDDLNMPMALAAFWEAIKDETLTDADKKEIVREVNKVFGLNLTKKQKAEKIPTEITKWAKEREKARKEKNWKKADKARDKIKELGYAIEDSENGFKVRKI